MDDERTRFHARALLIGERIDVRALESVEVLARAPLTLAAGRRGRAVVFRYGAVVLVDLEPAEEASFLHDLRPFVSGAFDEPDREDADIAIRPEQEERVDSDGVLSLREASLERVQVVAEVLAKSAVLSHYEDRVAKVFDRIEPLAVGLRSGTRSRVSDRELVVQIADVLLAQARTVGRVEVTEKPELTWDRTDLDRLYERLRAEYELVDRDRALERKLELVTRTVETLQNLLQNRRTLRVEWYIVILIAIEIVLVLYDVAVS